MNSIKRFVFGVFLFTMHVHADDSFKLVYYCDANNSTVYINKSIESPVPIKGNFKKLLIDWGSLAIYSKEKKDRYGAPFRAGSKVVSHTCGDIKINFSYGYLNQDSQGELGGIDFAVVEAQRNTNIILSKIALEECSISLQRFGPCPDRWAQSILIEPQTYERIRLTVQHVYD